VAADEAAPIASEAKRRARPALIWIGLAFTLAFGYLAVRNVDLGVALDALSAANLWWLGPAFALFAVSIVLRAERWRALFPAETRPPFRPVLDAVVIGYFFNSVLPARAGELARILALHRSTRASRVQSGATAALERALDLAVVLLLFLVAYRWLPSVTWVRPAAVLAGLLVAGLLLAAGALALFGERPFGALVGPAARLTRISAERLEEGVRNLGRGLVGLRRLEVAFAGVALTVLSWIATAVSHWFLTLGFDFGLSPLAGLLVAVATAVGMVLPSSPAALGVFEAAVVLALGAYGVESSVALPYAVLLHLLNFLPFLAAGPIALGALRRAG
jgi:uncharacterized protein (TIRG00374 family)